MFALRNYNQDVQIIIEDSPDTLKPDIWSELRGKTKQKDQTVKDALKHAKDARKNMSKLDKLLSQPDFDAPDAIKQQARLNIERISQDLDKAQMEFEREQRRTNITQQYWKKVEEARNHFIDEIEILFPNVNINEKKLELEGPELDLFILHAFSRVLYYQKELFKLQTIEEQKVRSALDSARRGNQDILTDAQIEKLVEKEKKTLIEEYQKRVMNYLYIR